MILSPTPSQRNAVEQPGNVLVLAGAGSGKTSTLVERCLFHILHPAHPVGVDEMLIVTFTDAAAAEVRQRLRERLERARDEATPVTTANLERQIALVESAHISTLHSFCLELVRQHFYEIGLDPSLTVFREEQSAVLREQALDTLCERHFESATEEAERVQDLIRIYGGGDQNKIRASILKLHEYTQTLVNPGEWLAEQVALFQCDSPTRWREWLQQALGEWCDTWGDALARVPGNRFASQFAGPVKAARGATPDRLASLFGEITGAIDPLPHGASREHKELKTFFAESAFLLSLLDTRSGREPLGQDWEWVRRPMETLLRLTEEFSQEYRRLKRDQASLDFHDLEQFALDLLTGPDRKQSTPVAAHWRRKFKLLFVDEYQDINAAQDAILRALARNGAEANRFLVGDVKQSIYRFRLADPAIFQAYNAAWRKEQSEGRVIPLSENFRSTAQILNFVNGLFGVIMRAEVGGVTYDVDARLRPGPSERPPSNAPCVDLNLYLTDRRSSNDEEPEENITNAELEARMVAQQLRELRERKHPVWSRAEKKFRPVEWSDMVVLLRSPGPKAEIYVKEFTRFGVPLQAARGGLFDSAEVSDLLSLLQLLDNPLQDVPLLAVLRSPLVGLTLDQLALIRRAGQKGLFWTLLIQWHRTRRNASGAEGQMWNVVDTFLERFHRWRRLGRHSGLSERIEVALKETEYLDWLLTQPRPLQRQANVRRFITIAAQFDPVQRQGLQRFLKFVEAQREAETDNEPEALESDNAVRLISIHKSKGLEFPVVAVAGLASPFNERELSESIFLDEHYGLCADVRPPGTRTSFPSLPWWLGRKRQRRELLGEELRLLYVALTRARDMLLLFGTPSRSYAEKKWANSQLDLREIGAARCPLDWLGPWCSRAIAKQDWTRVAEGSTELFQWRIWSDKELTERARTDASPEFPRAIEQDSKVAALLERMEWKYPQTCATKEPGKISVTALREENAEAQPRFRVRSFIDRRARSKLSAAEIGMAHHLFLQLLDVATADTVEALRQQTSAMLEQQVLSAPQAEALDLAAIAAFWKSDCGQKIRQCSDSLHREIPFTARFTREEMLDAGIQATLPADEFVVVQGTIDLAVIQPREIWIIDFKTDAVGEADVQTAVANYAPQLRLYGSALGRIYNRSVAKRWLHFLAASKTVEV
jgi:ATP-dependent helicase/nuclease subunit A